MELLGGCRLGKASEGPHAPPRRQKHPPVLPSVAASPLRTGFIISQGRGHSTGARATVEGDRLTGQARLPGHLPSLGVGGSRPGPTIGWCRGKGFSPEGLGQEPVLPLGTGDTGDPSLSKTWILDPTSPSLPRHLYTPGPQRGHSLLSLHSASHQTGTVQHGTAGASTQPLKLR